jgi:protein-tyrosine phosphatase
MSASVATPARFSILTVCTGNICRSPLAEHLLRKGLQRWDVVDVASSGTGALVGHPMTDQTIAIAHQHGVPEPERHRARALVVEQLRDADLVLALSREHRSEIVSLLPRGSRHTFTIRELARLLEAVQFVDLAAVANLPLADTAARFSELVHAAAALRGYVTPPENELDDDVIDPYRRGDDVYQQTVEQLVPAIDAILARFELAAAITSVKG